MPFRNREEHLPHFLKSIQEHQKNNSELNYDILIVEQKDSAKFNRAKLMNVGAKFAVSHLTQKCSNETTASNNLCLIFHDIDMLPMNPEMEYTCERR